MTRLLSMLAFAGVLWLAGLTTPPASIPVLTMLPPSWFAFDGHSRLCGIVTQSFRRRRADIVSALRYAGATPQRLSEAHIEHNLQRLSTMLEVHRLQRQAKLLWDEAPWWQDRLDECITELFQPSADVEVLAQCLENEALVRLVLAHKRALPPQRFIGQPAPSLLWLDDHARFDLVLRELANLRQHLCPPPPP